MNKKIIMSLLLAVLVLVSVSAVAAADINVKGTSFDDVQKAIDNANPGDSIYLNNCTYKVNETNHKPIIVNTSDLTIFGGKNANDNKLSTLDGLSISQIMSIKATNIKIIGVNFVNGYANYGGAIVLNPGSSLTIIDSSFYNNGYASDYGYSVEEEDSGLERMKSSPANEFSASAEPNTQYGGAIFASNSDLTVVNSVFTNNGAFHGGAIYGDNSQLNVISSLFTNNGASYGGAIYTTGSLTLTGSKFTENSANYYSGGAIFYKPSSEKDKYVGFLAVDDCTFSRNSANSCGGAIYAPWGALTISDSEFIQNNAPSGAAVFNSFQNEGSSSSMINRILNSENYLNIDNSIFTNNNPNTLSPKAANQLGYMNGMYGAVVTSYSISVDKSKFIANSANSYGGAIAITDLLSSQSTDPISSLFTSIPVINAVITNSEFDSNLASVGGAIAFIGTSQEDVIPSDKLTVYNCKFDSNSVAAKNSDLTVGGAILSMATTVVDESTFINNIINSSTETGLFGLSKNGQSAGFSYDLVNGAGGAIAVMGNLTLTNSNFEDNKALKGGAVAVVGTLFIDDCSFVNNNGSFLPPTLLEQVDIARDKCQDAYNNVIKQNPEGIDEFKMATEPIKKEMDEIYKQIMINVQYDDKIDEDRCHKYIERSEEYLKISEEFLNKYRKSKVVNNKNTIDTHSRVVDVTTSKDSINAGGAVFVIGLANINNSLFTNNYALYGGAIGIIGSCNLTNCGFESNTAKLGGGAIFILPLETVSSSEYSIQTQTNVVDCSFTGNSVIETEDYYSAGGAICLIGSSLNVTGSYFEANTASNGGAIALGNAALYDKSGFSTFGEFYPLPTKSNLYVDNSKFVENIAEYGGAIASSSFYNGPREYYTDVLGISEGLTYDLKPVSYISGYVTDCIFINNYASECGGAIAGAGLIVNYNIFEGNDAVLGSAIYGVSDALPMPYERSLISNYDYNFWGLANDVTKLPKNLISTSTGSLTPANWVVVDIAEPIEGGNVFGVNFVLNDGSELTGVMPDYAALLTVNDAIKSITIVKNEYTDKVDSTGKYDVAVRSVYEGNLLASTSFNVETLEMVVTTTVNGTTVTVTVKVAKDATGKVGFHLDNLLGIKYVDVVDGVAVCKYEKLAAGEHSVDVSYQGDDYVYKGSKATFTVSDMKISADDVDKFYKGPEQYVVTIVDGTPLAGETVSIFINGVEYTRVTDENGQAKMNINLNPGTYKVTAVYKGETVTNTIVVKSTVIGNDLTKIYCNDSQYYATFLDGEGKALANAAVWFNINGVIYNRVTDEHGIAELNINLLPGDYILTAYNSATGQLFTNMVHVLPQLVQVKTVDNLVALGVLDKKGQLVKAGETVLLNFKGKVLTATSDANGMVFFADPSFDGTFATAYYDGCLVNVNLTSASTNMLKDNLIQW